MTKTVLCYSIKFEKKNIQYPKIYSLYQTLTPSIKPQHNSIKTTLLTQMLGRNNSSKQPFLEKTILMMNKRTINHFEYSSKISSKYLSHFTPKFETLLKIVEVGFRPSECDEFQIYKQDYLELEVLNNWYTTLAGSEENLENLEHKIPMVCFSDIPLKYSSKHRKRYGRYCISLTKDWAIANGLSPLIYVPKDSKLHVLLNSINSIKNRLVNLNQSNDFPEINQLQEQLNLLFDLIKPYIDKNRIYKFYDEREWRYLLPSFMDYEPDNSDTYLKFNKEDFAMAIVQNAKEKNILLKKLRNKFGYLSPKKIKIKKL